MAEDAFVRLEKKKMAVLNTAEGACRVEAEIHLPEYKEEAERILRSIPKVVIQNKRIYRKDRQLICEIEGTCGFHVLYQTPGKEEGKVSSFLHSESFFQSIQIPCNTEKMNEEELFLFADPAVRSSGVKLLGPRKIGVKCEVAIAVEVKCNQSFPHFPQDTSGDLITRGSHEKVTRLRLKHQEEMSFSQTITLPKTYLPIEEVCEMEAVLFSQNVKAEDGGVSFLGLCDLHCSYTAAGERNFISFYQPIEFEKHMGIPELEQGHFCRVDLTPVQLKATSDINEDGENKNILFELVYLCEVTAFETEDVFITEDAFSTRGELLLEKKAEPVQALLGSFDFSDTAKGIIPSKYSSTVRVEGVCGGVEFREFYLEEGRLCLEGKLSFSYLVITDTDEMKNVEDSYEFKTYLTAPFAIPDGEECSIEVCGGVRGIDLDPDGEQMRLRFDLFGSICVFGTKRPTLICRMERGAEFEKKRGEILFVYPQYGEDLWSLAKEYHISPEKIKQQNHLTGDALPLYLKLIP